MKRPLVIVAVVLATLSGCAPGGQIVAVTPEPTVEAPSPSATPTPEATQEPETGLTQPEQLFDGSCSNAFGEGTISEVIGVPFEPTLQYAPDALQVEQTGGLLCFGGADDYSARVDLAIVSAELLAPVKDTFACQKGGLEFAPWATCFIEKDKSGLRLSGVVVFADGTVDANRAKAKQLIAAFADNAAALDTVRIPIPAEGAWHNPFDCAAFDEALDQSSAFGGTTGLTVYGRGGGDVFYPPAMFEVAGDYDTNSGVCSFGTSKGLTEKQYAAGMMDRGVFFIVGGAAWAFERYFTDPTATEITIEGADRALVTKNYGATHQIVVTRGPNLLVVTNVTQTGAPRANLIRQALDALDAAQG